uniref:Uncharacterized protein n=1 Tax=Rhizophora mucronata TaxID=61149 RepID=A0A2P2PCF0_RHIMU
MQHSSPLDRALVNTSAI